MDIGNMLSQAGQAAGKGTVKQLLAKGNGSDESISNNKVGAVVGGIGAIAALSALGIAATPAVGVALCAGALAGAKGESTTKKTAKVAGNVLIGTAALTGVVGLGAVKLAGGALGVATSGVRGGVSSLLGRFKDEQHYLSEGLAYWPLSSFRPRGRSSDI
jgi:hypothetical protein